MDSAYNLVLNPSLIGLNFEFCMPKYVAWTFGN